MSSGPNNVKRPPFLKRAWKYIRKQFLRTKKNNQKSSVAFNMANNLIFLPSGDGLIKLTTLLSESTRFEKETLFALDLVSRPKYETVQDLEKRELELAQETATKLLNAAIEDNKTEANVHAIFVVFCIENALGTDYSDHPNYHKSLLKFESLYGEKLLRAWRSGDKALATFFWQRILDKKFEFISNLADHLKLLNLGCQHYGEPKLFSLKIKKLYHESQSQDASKSIRLLKALNQIGPEALSAIGTEILAAFSPTDPRYVDFVAKLANCSSPEIAQLAAVEVRPLLVSFPRRLQILRPLLKSAIRTNNFVEQEKLLHRIYEIERRPLDGQSLVKLLFSRDKPNQAGVVADTLRFEEFDSDNSIALAFNRLVDLLLDSNSYVQDSEDAVVDRLEKLIEEFYLACAEGNNIVEKRTAIYFYLQILSRFQNSNYRASRALLQSSVVLNPKSRGRNNLLVHKSFSELLAEILNRIQQRIFEDLLHSNRVDDIIQLSSTAPSVLETLSKDLTKSVDFVRTVDKLEKIYGKSQWLIPYVRAADLARLRLPENVVQFALVQAENFNAVMPQLQCTNLVLQPLQGEYFEVHGNAIVKRNLKSAPWHLQLWATDLLLIDQDAVIVGGKMLAPGDFHTTKFPRTSHLFYAKIGDRVAFDVSASQYEESRPVVVLIHNDAAYTTNYYHQVALVAGRVALLIKNGYLKNRKLVVPSSTPDFLYRLFEVMGLNEDQLIIAEEGHSTKFKDALMVSPIEFLAEEAVRTMRDLVWKNLKISANAIPTRKLIVLRRGQVNRRTFDEHALVEQAVNAGYEEVYPEKMNFEDQVRLFSEASSIIALSGASLTNLIFARDEIAVVGISKSAVYSPTFVEISLALRQKHCWLLGQNQKLDNYLGVISSSYSLNHDEIAVALEWLAKNSEPNSPKKRRAKG